ncbi:hypothetical protein [Kocuria aegyptia]
MKSQLAPSPSRAPASALSAPGTFLAPADPFPSALAELDLNELQVLHSRICRQLEHEYLTAPDGPHPVTQDRCQELVAEFDVRQAFLAPPLPHAENAPGRAPASRRKEDRGADPLARTEAGPGRAPAPRTGTTPGPGPAPAPVPPTPRSAGGTTGAVIHDLAQVRPGDPIEVWQRGVLRCRGTIEEVSPALGVAWLLEAGDGYRRMFHAHDGELRRHLSPDGS